MTWANTSFNIATGGGCNCCAANNCCYTDFVDTVGGGASISSNSFSATAINSTAYGYDGSTSFSGASLTPYSATVTYDSHLQITGPAWINVTYSTTSGAALTKGATVIVTGSGGPITPDAEDQGNETPTGYANYTLPDNYCYVVEVAWTGTFDTTGSATLTGNSVASSNANIC